MRKYIIEVSEKGIKKVFIDGEKKYEEEWVRTEDGCSRTLKQGITTQLSEANYDEELIDLLDEEDIDEIWRYFEENKDAETSVARGKLIKQLAICSECNTDLLSKYENGVWGFSKVFKNENNEFYTKCPMCCGKEKYFIDREDIEDFMDLK